MKSIISENFGIKAGSLILALFIWLYAHSQSTQKITDIRVPVIIRPPTKNIVISQQQVRFLIVDFIGPIAAIQKLNPENIKIVKRVEKIPKFVREEMKVEIVPVVSDFNLPGNINVSVTPEKFTVKLARKKTQFVSVKPVIDGRPAKAFRVETVFTEPSEVMVSGPEPLIETLNEVPTVPINISGRKGFLNQKVRIDESKIGKGVECRELVTVYITIKKIRERKDINNIPLRILTRPSEELT